MHKIFVPHMVPPVQLKSATAPPWNDDGEWGITKAAGSDLPREIYVKRNAQDETQIRRPWTVHPGGKGEGGVG